MCTIGSGNLEALYGGQSGWCFGYIQRPFHCGLTLDGASSGGLASATIAACAGFAVLIAEVHCCAPRQF
jgi:hypothetical protein